jgi:succinoglycan biosynthesis protein ExoO
MAGKTSQTVHRVSVLIPSYNAADCLEAAVRSVLAQTEQDFEILIIDDGSKDATLDLARRLAAGDRRIRVLALSPNRGKVGAMNQAMDEACGAWIAVLDADDWYAPTRLSRLLDAAEAGNFEMVADDWVAVDTSAGLYLESPLPRRKADFVLDLDTFLKQTDPTSKGDYGMLKGIVRADFIRRMGLRYQEQARTGEDFYFLLEFFLQGGRCLVLNEALYYYVEPYGSVSLKWAQDGRKRYKFETLENMHHLILEKYAATLTEKQKLLLVRRDRGVRALVAFHQIREALQERQYQPALLKGLAALNLWPFWRMLFIRTFHRLKRLAIGSPRRVLAHAMTP